MKVTLENGQESPLLSMLMIDSEEGETAMHYVVGTKAEKMVITKRDVTNIMDAVDKSNQVDYKRQTTEEAVKEHQDSLESIANYKKQLEE